VLLTKGKNVFVIGLYVHRLEACLRDKYRGDRRIGLASERFDEIHIDKQYDLEVDTSKLSLAKCAAQIIKLVLM